VKSAATGRAIAMTGPMSPHVSRIESILDSGVVMRNDWAAGWDAPLRRSSTVIGTAPQLQTGSGTPMNAARSTPEMPGLPIHRSTRDSGNSTCNRPATKSPKRM